MLIATLLYHRQRRSTVSVQALFPEFVRIMNAANKPYVSNFDNTQYDYMRDDPNMMGNGRTMVTTTQTIPGRTMEERYQLYLDQNNYMRQNGLVPTVDGRFRTATGSTTEQRWMLPGEIVAALTPAAPLNRNTFIDNVANIVNILKN